ncbi:MAG: DNA adenine methylase [Candidatus Calescibacterium sp.]
MGKNRKYLNTFPYIGGKFYLLDIILKLIPEHEIYIEPFGGSAKVLINKPPSKVEIYNDLDKRIANLFYVWAFRYKEFEEKLKRLVYSQALFYEFHKDIQKPVKKLGNVNDAVKTFYLLQLAFSGNIKSKGFSISLLGIKKRMRFFSSLERLSKIHQRLKNVAILNTDFRVLIKKFGDREDAFFYLDPPYYGINEYYLKFTKQDHKDLLEMVKNMKAKWLLSNYPNELYDEYLKDFYRVEVETIKHSSPNKIKPKAIEVLWANYNIEEMLKNSQN